MHSPISLSNHVTCFCICLFIFIHTYAILHEITFYTLFCHEYPNFFLTLLLLLSSSSLTSSPPPLPFNNLLNIPVFHRAHGIICMAASYSMVWMYHTFLTTHLLVDILFPFRWYNSQGAIMWCFYVCDAES